MDLLRKSFPGITLTLLLLCSAHLALAQNVKKPKAVISGGNRTVYAGERVIFDGSDSKGIKLSYSWLFSDDYMYRYYGSIVKHVFKKPGEYTVTLRVKNRYGSSEDVVKVRVIKSSKITERIRKLIKNVENIKISNGNRNSLLSKLNNAEDSINKGNYNAAVGQLNAFLNQLDAFVNTGKLSKKEVYYLTKQTNELLKYLHKYV